MEDFQKEFSNRHQNLLKDLEYIDSKINTINKNIILLQSNIDRLTDLITNATDTKAKGQYFNIQSDILKTLSMYNDNMQRLLDLKFKYRTEQDDLTFKTNRFIHVELERVKSDIAKSSSAHNDVIAALTKLLSGKNVDNTQQEENKPNFNFNFTDDEQI